MIDVTTALPASGELSVDAAELRCASAAEWRAALRDTYDEYGLVVLRDLIDQRDVDALRDELRAVIQLAIHKLRHKGLLGPDDATLKNAHRFDAGMLDVCAADRAVGGEVFRVAKKLLSVQRLTSSRPFEAIARALTDSDRVAIHTAGTNVRADHPGEDHYLYPWHQDYLYNLGSQDSLTFWAPLVDVDDVNGCLIVAPKSHRQGILPVIANDPLNQNKNSAQSFTVARLEEVLRDFERVTVPMKAGDVVVFHGNLLHASQANRSGATRWSLQFRYFNLAAPDAVEFGWPGGMAEGFDFREYHPEAIRPSHG